MKYKIYIRTDGNSQIGLGHVVRCMALGQMLKAEFSIHFISKEIPKSIEYEMEQSGFSFTLIDSEDDFLNLLSGNEIVILDNYYFDSNYQKMIKAKGNKLICIDDFCHIEFYADLIINVSPNVTPSAYKAQNYTQFALGIKFALVRPAFLLYSGKSKKLLARKNILVCFGGSDPTNQTFEILKFLNRNYDGIINIVVGIAYQHLSELDSYIKDNSLSRTVNVYKDVDQHKLVKLMRDSGIAICSPSTVSIEYLSVSKGLLFLKLTAMNQNRWYSYAISNRLAYVFSEMNFRNLKQLKTNYSLQDLIFDGCQKERILKLLKRYEY